MHDPTFSMNYNGLREFDSGRYLLKIVENKFNLIFQTSIAAYRIEYTVQYTRCNTWLLIFFHLVLSNARSAIFVQIAIGALPILAFRCA